MSNLFATLGLAGSALSSASAAVRTVGQNIANANTEGYTRQRVELHAREGVDQGRVKLGGGVDLVRVGRVLDRRLEELLRGARSALGELSTRDRVLGRIEALLGELDGDSIISALERFFEAAEDLANRPEDHSARALFASRGEELAAGFRSRDRDLLELRRDLEREVETAVGEINRLSGEIASLNRQIVAAEGGGTNPGTANELRDQREELVKQLSEIVEVKAIETTAGSLNILAGSDFLVLDGNAKSLVLDTDADDGVLVSDVRFESDGKRLAIRGGRLLGLVESRDRTVVDIRSELDSLARAIIGEFNRVHSTGEGLLRWRELTATTRVTDPSAPLSSLALVPPARNGSFDLRVVREATGEVDTYNIEVDLDGLGGGDTSLADLVARINAAVGADHPTFVASVTRDGQLRIESGDVDLSFSFAGDSSGALAGLGAATFFQGTRALDIAVNAAVADDPRLIATGSGGGPTDSSGIARLIALRDAAVLEDGGATFEEFYRGTVGMIGVDRARARDQLANQRVIADHLANERAAISGVNLDDESIDLLRHQRAYQGAARYLSIVDSLMEALLNA